MLPRNSLRLLRCAILLLILSAPGFVFAQGAKATFAPAVSASATAEQTRFLADGAVTQMRLEVFDNSGARFYESDFKAGNLFDWNLQDRQGQRLPDGVYRCLLTVKDVAGRASQQQGLLLVRAGEAAWQAPEQTESALRAATAPGAAEQIVFFTVAPNEAGSATAALAHDGSQGRLMTGAGALSVRIGNFRAGQDQEQMRLTAEGKLGLGVSEPQAKLDVAGQIRASEGIAFPDGSVQTTAYVASGRSLSARNAVQRDAPGRALMADDKAATTEENRSLAPSISGSGTTNRLTKWADGPNGVVGDSVITEVGGNVGIGTTNPLSGFDYRGSTAAFYTRDIGTTNFGTAQSALQLGVSNLGARFAGVGPSMLFFGENSAGAKSFLGRVSAVWENPTAGAEAGALFFQVRANSGDVSALTERMRITAAGNVGIGLTAPGAKLDVAGAINTTAQYNIGGNRILANPGTGNLFAGTGAGIANTTGMGNAFFGQGAGQANTTAQANSFFGYRSGEANTTGNANTYFGYWTGLQNVTGISNSIFGATAGLKNKASYNSFFGVDAGYENTTGISNAFFGAGAGLNNTSGSYNAFFGPNVGSANTTGGDNSFFGRAAGAANTTASGNSFFGAYAGTANATGVQNSFFGANAGKANTVGLGNSFFGVSAGIANTTGNNNSFFGLESGLSNTTGRDNAFVGWRSGKLNTSGIANVFVGTGAGEENTTGGYNTFVGRSAGFNNADGIENAFFGYEAGGNNVGGFSAHPNNVRIGSYNAFFGKDAGHSNAGGIRNAFFGYRAGFSTAGGYSDPSCTGSCDYFGDANTFVGTESGFSNTTGRGNTFVGDKAGFGNTIGLNNTYLGSNAGGSANLNSATAIGANANVMCSGCIVLGSTNARVGIGTTNPNAAYRLDVVGIVNASGGYQQVSDLRYKNDIRGLSGALDKILRLRGVSYQWNRTAFPEMQFSTHPQLGFIAQEIEQVLPEAVTKDSQGRYSMSYTAVIPLLVEAIKEQQQQAEASYATKDNQLEQLKQENAALRQRLEAVEKALEKLHNK
jgi:hypothetical protein